MRAWKLCWRNDQVALPYRATLATPLQPEVPKRAAVHCGAASAVCVSRAGV